MESGTSIPRDLPENPASQEVEITPEMLRAGVARFAELAEIASQSAKRATPARSISGVISTS